MAINLITHTKRRNSLKNTLPKENKKLALYLLNKLNALYVILNPTKKTWKLADVNTEFYQIFKEHINLVQILSEKW